ncbi:PREDICTED: transmembrane protease serine 9-like [Polistes dominula]|uniref:Transmembrane protease serine 9-like n=1 Tax=Polistes dominula TaxID=743375 RepID=A0ABM1HX36_POLDO|nr:PREDICTED: transmembrane protease serine 9-like [Polistes dominula]
MQKYLWCLGLIAILLIQKECQARQIGERIKNFFGLFGNKPPTVKEPPAPCYCSCGLRNDESRIVGGQTTRMNELPWMVRLSYLNKFYCGGTLINDRYVLTAAHCVKGFMWFMIKVTFGEHDRCIDKSLETRYVVRVLTGDFSFLNFDNDIALLQLNDRVPFGDTIRPICLPTIKENEYVGSNAIASGWGTLQEEGKPSCLLKEVEVPVMSLEDCRNTSYSPRMISDNMLCAGYPDGKKDSCQGDSGGPLITEREDKRYEIIGIISWGNGCARPGYPGVYTRVTKYLDWILNNSKDGCFCDNAKVIQLKIDSDCDCGLSSLGLSDRIIGGKISNPHEFPWIVIIFKKGAIHCGGALINDRYVLTAGHCVKWTKAKDLTVGLGIHDVSDVEDGYLVAISKTILHKNFMSEGTHDTNDIALIKLQEPVEYDNHVQPICLPNKDKDYSGKTAKVTGWGTIAVNGATSNLLRETNLTVLSLNSCKKTSIGNYLTNSVMCAYRDNTDACQGDSGGPIFIEKTNTKYEIIGIVSWGLGCANKGVPGIYVKITDYLNWIKRHTADAVYCLDN